MKIWSAWMINLLGPRFCGCSRLRPISRSVPQESHIHPVYGIPIRFIEVPMADWNEPKRLKIRKRSRYNRPQWFRWALLPLLYCYRCASYLLDCFDYFYTSVPQSSSQGKFFSRSPTVSLIQRKYKPHQLLMTASKVLPA